MGTALPGLGLPSKADLYGAALEGLVQVNQRILEKQPDIPPLYHAGVVFKPIPHDTWRRADVIAGEGWGDCEGLAPYRVADLRLGRDGFDPDAFVACYHTGPRKYHAVVVRGDDSIEDPSVRLGMKARPTMPLDRYTLNLINGMWPAAVRGGSVPASVRIEGWDDGDPVDNLSTEFFTLPTGETQAQIKIPLADGSKIVAETTSAVDKATAMARAGNLLTDTATTIAKNPVLLAQMNPYVAAGVMLYSSPEVRRSLGQLGQQVAPLAQKAKGAVDFFRRIF